MHHVFHSHITVKGSSSQGEVQGSSVDGKEDFSDHRQFILSIAASIINTMKKVAGVGVFPSANEGVQVRLRADRT